MSLCLHKSHMPTARSGRSKLGGPEKQFQVWQAFFFKPYVDAEKQLSV